jgi:hypothetical protein
MNGKPSLLLSAPCSVTNLARLARTAPTYTCVKHQQTIEEIHQSKSRRVTAFTTISFPTIVMSTILITASNLQTPTWTIPILYAPLVHSNLAYPPSPGTPPNQNVARVTHLWVKQGPQHSNHPRSHGKQERDTKRSVPHRAHIQHLGWRPSAHRSRRPIYSPTHRPLTHPPPSP